MTSLYPTDDQSRPNPHRADRKTSEHAPSRESPRPPTRRPAARSANKGTVPQVVAVIDGTTTADYVAHTATLRGVVRQRLVTRALDEHLPPAPGRILDIGGGNGVQALALAGRGYDVTVCEPEPRMLDEARRALTHAPKAVQDRVELVQGDGRDAARLVGGGWDATLCHGVIMFVPEPAALLNVLADLTRPGGIISVVGKNGPALALRAGLQGRWLDVRSLFDQHGLDQHGLDQGGLDQGGLDQGGLDQGGGPHGVVVPPPRPGDDPAHVAALLTAAGSQPIAWYGIRTFTDHLGDTPPGPDLDDVVEAEWAAGKRDPYRRIARLIHHIHRRDH